MNILAFDTSGALLAVALSTARGRSAEIRDLGLRHGELLAPLIDSLLKEAGLSVTDLDLIVCSRGPGSFTGLRIGMATAKGLAAGSGVPVVSVAVPDFLARGVRFCDLPVITVQDGKKNRFYGALFKDGTRKSDYFDLSAEAVIRTFHREEKLIVTGPDAVLFTERLEDTTGIITAGSNASVVFDLLELGSEQFAEQGPDAPGQGPFYIRKSEAEISQEKGRGE